MLLCATVVRDAAGEVGLTGGTPVLLLISFLSGIETNLNHQNGGVGILTLQMEISSRSPHRDSHDLILD